MQPFLGKLFVTFMYTVREFVAPIVAVVAAPNRNWGFQNVVNATRSLSWSIANATNVDIFMNETFSVLGDVETWIMNI